MENDLIERLRHLSIADQLLDRGLRLVFPKRFCGCVSGSYITLDDITELDAAAILQEASTDPYFDVGQGSLKCRMYHNPRDGGLIIFNLSKPNVDIYVTASKPNSHFVLRESERAALCTETWTLGTSLDPEVFIFRIVDPYKPSDNNGVLQRRNPFDFGRFTDLHLLGGPDWFSCVKKTGSNSVYKVKDLVKGTVIVVKSLWTPGVQNDTLINRVHSWKKEVIVHSQIHHDSIAQYLGHDGRSLLIFTEFIAGSDLSMMTDAYSMFTGPHAVSLAIWLDVTKALIYLRDLGVVHHDIKPANIIWDDKNRRAKLLDFGLATKGPNSHSGGSPWYVAPEYWILRQRDHASDTYSFGIVMLYFFQYIPLPDTLKSWNIQQASHDANSTDAHVMRMWVEKIDNIRSVLNDPKILGMIDPVPRKRFTPEMLLKQLELICPKGEERSRIQKSLLFPIERLPPVSKGSTTIPFTASLSMANRGSTTIENTASIPMTAEFTTPAVAELSTTTIEIPTSYANSSGSIRITRRNRAARIDPLRRSERLAKRSDRLNE